jgi:hypothetical protein
MLTKSFFSFLLLFGFATSTTAEVWDWSCESAIIRLKNAQEDVASTKEDVDSAKTYYQLCTPSRYNDCELERMTLNGAIDDFNSAISDFNYALNSFKNSCLD